MPHFYPKKFRWLTNCWRTLRIPLLTCWFILGAYTAAQAAMVQCRMTLTVLDEKQTEVIGAYVTLTPGDLQAVTDVNGEATFLLDCGQTYQATVQYLGYATKKLNLPVPTQRKTLQKVVTLTEVSANLDEIVVTGQSQAVDIENLPYKVQVLSLNNVRAQPVPVTALLNQLPGIRIRQEGGAGSDVNIMLNGVDGKGVKLFVDGIPVYLLGAGYGINTLSPNMIDRIEVYKGTIPVAFGSDALGGVLNVVSRYGNADYLDVSYSFGSWNTHEAALTARQRFGRNDQFFVHLDGFYNYSDNDYWMDDVQVLVPDDPNNNTQLGRARRFHDQFTSLLTRLQTGVRDLPWADELMAMVSYSRIDREWQHGIRAENPWGEPESTQDSRNVSLAWKKYGPDEKWSASLLAGYTFDELSFVDTARRTYFWDQNFVMKPNGGETALYSNGTAPILTTRTWFGRQSFSYAIHPQHTLNLTNLLTNDEVTIRNGLLPLEAQEGLEPAQLLLKNYVGLALASKLLDEKLTNTLSIKHFYTRSSGITFMNRIVGPRVESDFAIFGYGDVVQYQINPRLKLNAGYEFT
ncbi:MAG: TonB-dependent receptor plug domain-containing protein, partial [Bacteroidota bacterium]